MKNILALSLIVLAFSSCGMEQVDEGYRGIKTRWGSVEGTPLSPGLHFYNPISSDIFEIEVREQKVEGNTEAFTKDTQKVVVGYATTFYPKADQIGTLYSQFGKQWSATLINQAVLGSIKDTIGQTIADDLVSKRELTKKTAEDELKSALAERGIIITRLDLTNLDFDDQYEQAVEAKVVAIQKAAEAKNRTVEVEEKAKQTVSAAKADAESMRIKSDALSRNQGLVEYEAIQKWDGKLPGVIFGGGSSVPMINIDKIMERK